MTDLDPVNHQGDEDNYEMAEDENGVLRCSCGRELIQLDEETWQCTGGYPTYRIKDGSIFIDKFGNMMITKEPHGDEDNKNSKENKDDKTV